MAAQAKSSVSHQAGFEAGRVISGTPYRALGLVGQGGMGSVHEVLHVELGRTFVLKVLHDRLAARRDLVARMKNEWTALAALSHPNIVQVIDAGHTADGRPYYVMERLEGETVGNRLKRCGPWSMRKAGQITMDVLAGLAAAHAMGAVHRDVKPQNVFLVRDGPAKVLDFGIAQVRDQAALVVTAAGVSIGTPRYMAPEQAEGRRVDGRADIYASALVLYEMLLGRGPFAHVRDPNELVLSHIGEEPARLDWLGVGVSAEMADLVQRWLSKRPDSRPFNAATARAELAALIASLPPEEDPDAELTCAGDYDAPTVGGPPAAAGRGPTVRRGGQVEPAAPSASTLRPPPESTTVLAPTVSVEAEVPGVRSEASPRTLGWGTEIFEEPVEVRDAAQLRGTFSAPAAQATARGSAGLGGRVGSWMDQGASAARLLITVTAVSFAASLLVSLWFVGAGSAAGGSPGSELPVREGGVEVRPSLVSIDEPAREAAGEPSRASDPGEPQALRRASAGGVESEELAAAPDVAAQEPSRPGAAAAPPVRAGSGAPQAPGAPREPPASPPKGRVRTSDSKQSSAPAQPGLGAQLPDSGL